MTTEQDRYFPDRPDEARGVRIPEGSSSQEAEDVLDPEGYDESQRAEILEAEGRGPPNGVIQTGLLPDDGEGDEDDDEVEDDEDELDHIEDTDELYRDEKSYRITVVILNTG